MNTVITGTGHCLPEKIVENSEIVAAMNTTENFIVERTGVLTRRHVESKSSVKDLLVPAARDAIRNAGLHPYDIDLLIVNTLSPDYHDPSEACLIQPLLGLRKIPVMDIRAQCSGMLYGMDVAHQYIRSGKCRNVLVACGEVLSKRMDTSDAGRNLSILLGDGAGALVLSASEKTNAGIIDLITYADGDYFELLWTQSPGSANVTFSDDEDACRHFRMNGKVMFNHATESLVSVAREILEKNGLNLADIDVVIPHQPNLRILDAVRERLEIPDGKMLINVHQYGNMASASLPVTLSEYIAQNESLEGKLALIISYGSGATWGAALYRF